MKPLYLQSRDNELTDNQFMDLETVEWIEARRTNADPGPVRGITLSDSDLKLLEVLAPRRSYFLNVDNYGSIHGIRHIMRVMVNTLLLCRILNIDYHDHVIAASVHDLRRLNDRRDIGHGKRAAKWFSQNLANLPVHAELIQDVEAIYYSTYYHDTDYGDIPPSILSTHKRSIDILKAADGIDRYRQPNTQWWPNMKYIELKESSQLLNVARRLVIQSERLALTGTDSVQAVLQVARQITA